MNDDQHRPTEEHVSTPRPDPTIRTLETLRREIGALKELFDREISAMKEAVKLLADNANKSPTVAVVNELVGRLEAVTNEKFRRIDTQISERDTRTEQSSRDAKVAIDAALQAQKEAVSEQNKSNAASMTKSEAGFTKLLDQQQLMIQQNTKTTDEKIEDLKGRVNNSEGQTKGSGDAWGIIIGVIIGVAGLLIAIAAIAVNFIK